MCLQAEVDLLLLVLLLFELVDVEGREHGLGGHDYFYGLSFLEAEYICIIERGSRAGNACPVAFEVED